jgi:poly-beta-1,6-N-acetyl-D-glucosamine synthase
MTPNYVLVTAAYNEGKLIENTIRSIISQTHPPARWVIVSDGSTDATDEIVQRYAAEHPFLQLARITEDHPRNFAAQADAINHGLARIGQTEYGFIGNMDADITLEPDYFARLLQKFEKDPSLGLGGGAIFEPCADGQFRERPTNSTASVAHACQLFRRECFEAIGGGYRSLPYGGPDTHAAVVARMKGWQVESFADLKVFHHRPTGTAGGALPGFFRQGKMDYSLGTLPLFEFLKLLRRVRMKPYVIGSMVRLAGFLDSYWRGEKRAVPDDFVAYFQDEQRQRMKNFVRLPYTPHQTE